MDKKSKISDDFMMLIVVVYILCLALEKRETQYRCIHKKAAT